METEYQKLEQIRMRMMIDFPFYAENCLIIRPKDGSAIPFKLNKAQKYLHAQVQQQKQETGAVRIIVLKGRQQGISTYIDARSFWFTANQKGVRSFILTHDSSATENLFEMAKRFYDNCPSMMKPSLGKSNQKELFFDLLDSGYKVGTAGNKGVGRSSTIQFLHASEAAFYDHADELSKGIFQAVPYVPNSEIFIESTANGTGNWFHNMWQQAEAGTSRFKAVFLPWYWQDEYAIDVPPDFEITPEESQLIEFYGLTDRQLAWRRMKIADFSKDGMSGEEFFMQEYPNNAVEAFVMSAKESYIKPPIVMTARKQPDIEKYGPLIIGVDPAVGGDRTAIIRRQGRVAYNLQTFQITDLMETTGIVKNIIDQEKPVRVFIDVIGIGVGMVDRLREMGYGDIVKPINCGNEALNKQRFYNKKCEMWGLLKEWLYDLPCKVPDSNELMTDICAPRDRYTSNTQLKIESKEDLARRGMRSTDCADALCLTFAEPVALDTYKKRQMEDERARIIMDRTLAIQKNRQNRPFG